MNLWSTRSERTNSRSGVLFERTTPKLSRAIAQHPEASRKYSRGRHRLAFAGLILLTLIMYLRPSEVMPGVFGSLPLAKIVAISTMLIYIISKSNAGELAMIWPLEMKMAAAIWILGLLLIPIAISPQDSFNILFDQLIKTLLVFILLINLVDTRSRLRSLLLTMVLCELIFALSAIKAFLAGEFNSTDGRIKGWGIMFNNPNDLASLLNMLLPFAVIFALTRSGWRKGFYFACASATAIAVLLTFSRSGFIGLVAACGVLVWKFSRGHRTRTLFAAAAVSMVLLMNMPATYWDRLSTIFNPEEDKSLSAQERQEVMKRASMIALTRPITGIGMGNFHIYSIREMRAHNSYLETAAELGVIGLIAFLILIFAPIRSLRRIERETAEDGARPEPEIHIICVCLQASFVALIIYGFFGSIQYDNYLYFIVAYAVALRRIHSAEIRETAGASDDTAALETHDQARLTKGILWRPNLVRPRWLIGCGKELTTGSAKKNQYSN